MLEEAKVIWSNFAKNNLNDKRAPLRLGTSRKQVRPWLMNDQVPAHPLIKKNVVPVYYSWQNPSALNYATEIVNKNEKVTVRELVLRMVLAMKTDATGYPYVWWFYEQKTHSRLIYEDANGLTFVRIDNKFHLAFNTTKLGALVGAQSSTDYESLPKNAYFLSVETEKQIMQYF